MTARVIVVATGQTGPAGSGGGTTALDDLTDVTITAAASGDIIRHNGTAWVDAVGTTHFEVAGAAATATSTAASALSAHEADTTAIHGIANTANLYAAGGTDVAVADGGTGASTAAGARTNLGVVIGTDVQAFDADLTALAAAGNSAVLAATTASFLTADETKLDGIEALADVTDAANVTAAGAHMAGGTDVPVADGGTGASTAAAARTNLGLVIGTDVAAQTHATQHKTGGADSIKLDELAAPTDVTTLNASTTAHGLLKKLSNVSTEYMNGQGNWATPAGGGSITTDTAWAAKGDLIVATANDTAAVLTVGTNGSSPLADSNQTTGIKWVGAPATRAPRTVSGAGYHWPNTILNVANGASQAAATAQEAIWWPFWLPRRCSPTITVYCFTLEAGSTVRMSTWSADDATFRPATGGLIEDMGTVSGATTGAKALTVTTPIGPGWVWVGLWASNNTTVRWGRNSGAAGSIDQRLMGDNAIFNSRGVFGWSASSLDYSAAWNSTLPTLAGANTTTNASAIVPYMENI